MMMHAWLGGKHMLAIIGQMIGRAAAARATLAAALQRHFKMTAFFTGRPPAFLKRHICSNECKRR